MNSCWQCPGCRPCSSRLPWPDLLDNAEPSIAAGKHVHLDNPAGPSLPHYKRILDAAAERTLIVQMAYIDRSNPAIVLLRQAVAEG